MIIDSFDKGAAQYPERAFIDAPGLRLTYAEAEAASHAVARALGKIVVPGGHVAILSPNHPMVPAAMLGVMRSGAVYVPLNARDAIALMDGGLNPRNRFFINLSMWSLIGMVPIATAVTRPLSEG